MMINSVRNSNGTGSGQIRLALLIVTCAVLATPLAAQVSSIEDASPSFSNLMDANGGSGGRVNGLAVDPSFPSRYYAASEWGGIYRSQDGGVTWQRLDGHRPVATWDVAVDPTQTFVVYATSFFDGKSPGLSQSGINRSADNGATWAHPATAVPPPAFCANPADQTELSAFGIDFDPTNSSKVYIGTSCGLAISNNSGVTWTFRSPPIGGATRVWDVLVNSTGTIVDTCGDAGHWWLNVGANTWQQGSGILSGRCSLAASPYDDTNLFAAVGFSIFETENRSNWTQTRINPTPKGRIPFIATNKRSFAPVGRNFDLWFGDTSLWNVTCDSNASPSCGTEDNPPWQGGFTRFAGAHDDAGALVFDPTASNDACPTAFSSDGGIYLNNIKSSPFCHVPDWDQPNITPHGLWPLSMSGADRTGNDPEDLYLALQDNGVFGTTSAGSQPPPWTNATPLTSADAAAGESNGGTIVYSRCCFAGGTRTLVFKKGAGFTGGGTGQLPNLPSGVAPEGRYPDVLARWGDGKYVMVTRDFGYGFPPDGGVYVTKNINAGIIAWAPYHTNASTPPTSQICGVRAGTSTNGIPTFYVQTGGCNADTTTDRMFKYTGDTPGGVWTEITLPQGGFGLFDVDKNNPQNLIAVGFSATDFFVFTSTNGGSSWTPRPQLKSLMNGGGNFVTKNSRGPTDFTSFNGYLQPSLVAIDPDDPRIMVAGGRDSGIFLSTDSGANWTLVTDPYTSHTSGTPHIPRPRFAYFDSEPGAKSIYIGSQGRGVWRLNLTSNCPANVTVANQTLTGTEMFGAADTLTAGPNLTVQGGASPRLEAGTKVSITNGTSVVGDLTVDAGGLVFCQVGPVQQVVPGFEWRGTR